MKKRDSKPVYKAEKLYSKALDEAWGAEDTINKINKLVEDENKKDYNEKSEVQANGEKADQKGTKYSIGERKHIRDNNQQERLFGINDNGRGRGKRAYKESYYKIETAEGVRELVDNVIKNKLFKEKSVKKFYLKVINDDSLPQYLLDVKEENSKLNIETFFVVETMYKRTIEGLSPSDNSIVGAYISNAIIIKMEGLTKKDGMISINLNHERLHLG